MVPMLEERDVVGGAAAHSMQQEDDSPMPQIVPAQNARNPNRFSTGSNSLPSITRERKAGTNLPSQLLRQGNEIVQNIYLDEVFAALKEVLSLKRDTLSGSQS